MIVWALILAAVALVLTMLLVADARNWPGHVVWLWRRRKHRRHPSIEFTGPRP